MARRDADWDVDVAGYMDREGARHVPGDFDNPSDAQGVFFHVVNRDDPDEEYWLWTYHPRYFTSWDEIWEHIEIAIEESGNAYAGT